MLLLETATRARRRGARIHAELACARTAGVAAPPYTLSHALDATAEKLVELACQALAERAPSREAPVSREATATDVRSSRAISAVLGSADGSEPRAALDAAVLRALARHASREPAYVPYRRLTGEWGAAGALGAALAALAIGAGHLPQIEAPSAGRDSGTATAAPAEASRSILVVGAARSGIVAPVVLTRADMA
jgi:3-oxoacyl-(acyl-carrier-protein) synthase